MATMKKIITVILAALAIFAAAPSTSVEAQPVYVGYCCDGGGFRRCVINPTPLGNPCFCYGQGWGYACY
jgi:hypothetical protein